ncbi:MAG: MFS transporter [Thermoanaerobaculia bacterium]|nr:MFS transporter [Thermoanaerobaculia bacterium]
MRTRRPLPRLAVLLGVTSFLSDVASEMIYPLLPVLLATSLGAGALAVGWVEGAAESLAAFLKLLAGWGSDRSRRKKPWVVAGYALAGVARPLVAFAGSVGQVLAVRLTDRVGKGLRSAPRDALLAAAVDPADRGRAFGFHRAADHAGALVGPLVAAALLAFGWGLETVFLWAFLPGLLAPLVVLFGVRERLVPEAVPAAAGGLGLAPGEGRALAPYLVTLALFTLGNSTDAFLLLRAVELGVPAAAVPLLWAFLHAVKSGLATWGGGLSDRLGRRRVITCGWGLYGLVYLGLAGATTAWQVWGLFALYGLHYALVEGAEKALVADFVPAARRGAAFGWYHGVIGLCALPASVAFGALWQLAGASVAFTCGALLAGFATALLATWVRVPAPRE